jgi:ABC-type transport system involved in multi-copper enzyme maturation permease subunit
MTDTDHFETPTPRHTETERPGAFLSFLVAAYGHTLITLLRRRRTLAAVLLTMLPPLLPLIVVFFSSAQYLPSGGRVYASTIESFYLVVLCPLLSLFFGTMLLGEEAEGDLLHYILTRPVPRLTIVLGRLAACLTVAVPVICISIALMMASCFALADFPPVAAQGVLLLRHWLAAAVALTAYCSITMFLGAATRWPVAIGIASLFAWQRLAMIAPGVVDFLTIEKYAVALLPALAGQRARRVIHTALAEFEKEQFLVSFPRALAVLLIVSAVFVIATTLALRMREYSKGKAVAG